MNTNKSENDPPLAWNPDDKSAMGQPAPPPYQAFNDQGVAPGYPPQGYGYYPTAPGGAYPGAYPGQFQPGATAVTMQPTVYVTHRPLDHPVNDYLAYSIFTMLCCCLPLGIAALIYSISAREANAAGDQFAAERSSRTARLLNHVALGIGLAFLVLMIIYVVVVVALSH